MCHGFGHRNRRRVAIVRRHCRNHVAQLRDVRRIGIGGDGAFELRRGGASDFGAKVARLDQTDAHAESCHLRRQRVAVCLDRVLAHAVAAKQLA